MSVIDDWINPLYLADDIVRDIRESIIAKPFAKYVVLDNFYQIDKLEQLIEHHKDLEFSEQNDRVIPNEVLPYDSAVVFAKPNVHFGSELFFDNEYHQYLAYLVNCKIDFPTQTEVKLRYHRPDAGGFWIHTDSVLRTMVAISYFNKGWVADDGGLLQLWHVDDVNKPNTFSVNCPNGRFDFLNKHKRINTSTPGGGFADNKPHDLILVDQIVPTYNRMFLCNYQYDPAYHSVTPSNGKARTGIVQWLGKRN